MTKEEIIEMAKKSDFEIHLDNLITWYGIECTNELIAFAKLVEDKKQNDIEILYALYEQASAQRGVLMEQQKEMILKIRDANEIIFKSCVNLPHWKRTAMRYLKRNAPQAHQLAVNEFNEHPDGRGQE